MVSELNIIEVATPDGGRSSIAPADSIGSRAAQIVLMRRERDVTVRSVSMDGDKSSGTSIRPGAGDHIRCSHGSLDDSEEARAQKFAAEAVESGVLEIATKSF